MTFAEERMRHRIAEGAPIPTHEWFADLDTALEAARAEGRREAVREIRERLPRDWREQLNTIRSAVTKPANAEQITLLDLTNKALRVLAILDEVAGLNASESGR